MGGFSDRIGAFAYALTPLSVFLSQRESILSLITGMPTQSFNFIHRWLGHIIFAQSMIHTIIWTIIEAKLYQPQPKVYTNFIKQTYMIWGIVAMGLLSFIWVFSFPRMIRLTGYEFFRKSHAIVALIYLGACWGHWNKLACWMIASLAIVFMDFGIRYIRTLLIHVGYMKSGGKKSPCVVAMTSLTCLQDTDSYLLKQHFNASTMQRAESSASTSSIITAHGPLVNISTSASQNFRSGRITRSQWHLSPPNKPSTLTTHTSCAA